MEVCYLRAIPILKNGSGDQFLYASLRGNEIPIDQLNTTLVIRLSPFHYKYDSGPFFPAISQVGHTKSSHRHTDPVSRLHRPSPPCTT